MANNEAKVRFVTGKASDSSNGLSVSGTQEHGSQKGEAVSVAVGGKEFLTIRALRLAVVFGLFFAVPLAIGVYAYTRKDEQNKFSRQFQEFGLKVLEASGTTFERSFGALDNLAISMVASSHAVNQTFPNVRIPNFGVKAAKTLALSKCKALVTAPLVTDEQYDSWIQWTSQEGRGWVDETLQVVKTDQNFHGPIVEDYETVDFIHVATPILKAVERGAGQEYLPSWQSYPIIPSWPPYNFEYFRELDHYTAHVEMFEAGNIILTPPYLNPDPNDEDEMISTLNYSGWLGDRIRPDEIALEPASDVYFPVYDNLEVLETSSLTMKPVAAIIVTFYWRDMIRDILPDSAIGILVVVENPCSAPFTYRLDGSETTLVGRGDLHESKYNQMGVGSVMTELDSYRIKESSYSGPDLDAEQCPITITIFPSQITEDEYITHNPIIFSGVAVLICCMATALFLVYDLFQERRQRAVMDAEKKSNAVVSSLFPAVIREKMYENQKVEQQGNKAMDTMPVATIRPIAELYTDTTVAVADIPGFAAWSSTHDATDVFTFLETMYSEFDALAREHGVFKVETALDCYVAVCGLPEPQADHAVVMARFCAACRTAMIEISQDLATTLGLGTESLCTRFGLSSGPTTAGVLRGDRSRFQLFGDTANAAVRMGSTSSPNHIQVSQKTADLLIVSGKSEWLSKRNVDSDVDAWGKRQELVTFWVEPDESRREANLTNQPKMSTNFAIVENRLEKLIDFNVDVLEGLLRDLVAHNLSTGATISNKETGDAALLVRQRYENSKPRDEVADVIPMFDDISESCSGSNNTLSSSSHRTLRVDPSTVELSPQVLAQLRSFVTLLANHHHTNENPFHNFDRATHVAISARTLLARISKPPKPNRKASTPHSRGSLSREGKKNQSSNNNNNNNKRMITPSLDKVLRSTYVLTSDPMISFAVYFSALILDAEHPGVSSEEILLLQHQKDEEGDPKARQFEDKSCVKQHSVVVAWKLLLSEPFCDMRGCLFGNVHPEDQIQRFRRLIVNAVMATDLRDKELQSFRERRWSRAFNSINNSNSSSSSSKDDSTNDTNDDNDDDRIDLEGELRATVVMEHILQASDVIHTMQHWTIYQTWNQRLFAETRAAFTAGRTDLDPALGWYEGELGVFDNNIIPLARKLKVCGVFGVSCDDVLDSARENRMEWEQKGKEIIRRWVEQDDERTLKTAVSDGESSDECTENVSNADSDTNKSGIVEYD